jgi:nitrite reductase/ring-hydroxylating ferredoxin subunit
MAVAQDSEVCIGTNPAFDVNVTSILVTRTQQGMFAFENRCIHALQALKGGKTKAFHIFCRLHDVRFYMREGHL